MPSESPRPSATDALQRVRDAGNWFPAPTRAFEKVVAAYVATGVPFSDELAELDLLYWLDRGELKPSRYYAKRWGWKPTRTYEFIAARLERTESKQTANTERTKDSDSGAQSQTERTTGERPANTPRTVLPDLRRQTPDNTLSRAIEPPAETETRVPPLRAQAEEVYRAYPRKVGRDAALRAIAKVLQNEPLEAILDATRSYAEAVATWPEGDRRFVPHPATWFNQGRYADDRAEWRRDGEGPQAQRVIA